MEVIGAKVKVTEGQRCAICTYVCKKLSSGVAAACAVRGDVVLTHCSICVATEVQLCIQKQRIYIACDIEMDYEKEF